MGFVFVDPQSTSAKSRVSDRWRWACRLGRLRAKTPWFITQQTARRLMYPEGHTIRTTTALLGRMKLVETSTRKVSGDQEPGIRPLAVANESNNLLKQAGRAGRASVGAR